MYPSDKQNANPSATELKSVGGVTRIFNALRYSAQGLRHAVRFEAAFRQELMVAVPAFIILFFLPVTKVEKILLLASVLLMLIVELLNSAVEAVVDRVSTERHPLSGRAKDMGSASVLLTVLLMVITWGWIAGPVVFNLILRMF